MLLCSMLTQANKQKVREWRKTAGQMTGDPKSSTSCMKFGADSGNCHLGPDRVTSLLSRDGWLGCHHMENYLLLLQVCTSVHSSAV